jgi:hypothetical protein
MMLINTELMKPPDETLTNSRLRLHNIVEITQIVDSSKTNVTPTTPSLVT